MIVNEIVRNQLKNLPVINSKSQVEINSNYFPVKKVKQFMVTLEKNSFSVVYLPFDSSLSIVYKNGEANFVSQERSKNV